MGEQGPKALISQHKKCFSVTYFAYLIFESWLMVVCCTVGIGVVSESEMPGICPD